MPQSMLDPKTCHKARLAKDARFDGKFFTAVKTTAIYCRPICPAPAPKEDNVEYYSSAMEAAQAGYRPCLRCRPDSAPGSPAWRGVNTTLDRAIRFIHEGALQESSLEALAERLGITDRYLRKLFKTHLGVSPKTYAQYQQCLFAKQLLHQTQLPISEIALASGFNSIRRFNDCFSQQMNLTPTQVRKQHSQSSNSLALNLYYRPPYNWSVMQAFLAARSITGLEWCDTLRYGRTFQWEDCKGQFTAKHVKESCRFEVIIELDNIKHLKSVINNIKRILDLDADLQSIERSLKPLLRGKMPMVTGIRLPGIWSLYEAGIRAILGQQVSVEAAHRLVTHFIHYYGEQKGDKFYFPNPSVIIHDDLDSMKMPKSRKQTLKAFSQHCLNSDNLFDIEDWLSIKGIGPWTIDYAKMRGLSDPDIFLDGDLGVKKALSRLPSSFNPDLASPWRSYLTLQCWQQQ